MKENKQYVTNQERRETGLSLVNEEDDEGTLRGTLITENDNSVRHESYAFNGEEAIFDEKFANMNLLNDLDDEFKNFLDRKERLIGNINKMA